MHLLLLISMGFQISLKHVALVWLTMQELAYIPHGYVQSLLFVMKEKFTSWILTICPVNVIYVCRRKKGGKKELLSCKYVKNGITVTCLILLHALFFTI